MAKKNSGNVTITLSRTTVGMLRAKKRGLETWDMLMQRLGRRRRCVLECLLCGAEIETTEDNITLNKLAEKNGWEGMYQGLAQAGSVKVTGEIGYMCKACADTGKCAACANVGDCCNKNQSED